jgi:hypothetical protein
VLAPVVVHAIDAALDAVLAHATLVVASAISATKSSMPRSASSFRRIIPTP